jgi:serine/threonine-protein kinase
MSPVEICIDDVSFRLRRNHNFDWLCSLGKVFCVFDQQDSGNISFGVEMKGRQQFVKYAGAETLHYSGKPQDAVERLKQATLIYQKLVHPQLVRLVTEFEAGEGYAAVFEWFDGENLHPHWSFPPPAKYNDPKSPFYRYKQLPVEQRLASIECIFSFHVYVEREHYVAVDFYDGSILYDFRNHITKLCDIDVYQIKPFINKMGRLWGSSRFMSPEEFELGASIDERTNVFNMGATAFCLLGGERDRSFAKWEAGEPLYKVALQAVETNRNQRFSSVAELYSYWNDARNK